MCDASKNLTASSQLPGRNSPDTWAMKPSALGPDLESEITAPPPSRTPGYTCHSPKVRGWGAENPYWSTSLTFYWGPQVRGPAGSEAFGWGTQECQISSETSTIQSKTPECSRPEQSWPHCLAPRLLGVSQAGAASGPRCQGTTRAAPSPALSPGASQNCGVYGRGRDRGMSEGRKQMRRWR